MGFEWRKKARISKENDRYFGDYIVYRDPKER